MIISHEHRFIFLKCRKVAGSSMERSLSEVCGPSDIVTRDPCQAPIARNYDRPVPVLREILGTYEPIRIARSVRDWRKRPAFYSHVDAYVARARLGKKTWDSYFKFCFERNPWDKCVSFYYWLYRNQQNPVSFAEHFKRTYVFRDRYIPSDWWRYTIGNNLAVDFVGKFENKEADFKGALSNVGLTVELSHAEKTGTRPKSTRNLRDLYTPELIDLVAKYFAWEIRTFGYEFPG